MAKQLTERESRKNLTLSTLERTLIQNTLGANLASDVTKYGTEGKEVAKGAFDNEEIKKAKEEEYQRLSRENESLGVAGDPSYAYDNNYISNKILNGLEQAMEISYLEDLAEGVNKFIPGLDFKLPDKLKGYVHSELIQKAITAEGKLDVEKLSKDEEDALGVYQNLREAYRLHSVKNIDNSNYLKNEKEYLNGIMEKYNPTPKEAEEDDK